ncbi:MAG TPA: transcription elongation factor GreA, partial [Clostridium sp.]|nr:transcription elongation factor GreA [Clostridium sp.]
MYNYLTEKSLQILKDELEHRKNVVRFQINEELKEARAHGDL